MVLNLKKKNVFACLYSVREEKLFLYPLRGVPEDLQIKLTKNINRRKGTQFLLLYMCMGVHRKEQKLKEEVRLRGVNTLLTKERGFGLQGTMNYGKGTRKYVGGTNGK